MSSAGVSIKAVTFRYEAELVVLSLEAAGITAWLVDQHLVSADPFLSNAVGGIKINVSAEDEARARTVLAELDRESPAGDRCLSCGAPMTESQQACAACGWTYRT